MTLQDFASYLILILSTRPSLTFVVVWPVAVVPLSRPGLKKTQYNAEQTEYRTHNLSCRYEAQETKYRGNAPLVK